MNRDTTVRRDVGRFAGGAGVLAATCAAPCCAGAPIIVSVLGATGLSSRRSDSVLIPVILLALGLALWGFWRSQGVHGVKGLFVLGITGSVALVAGVAYLHGMIAEVLIGGGTIALLIATAWNARLPRACDVHAPI